MLERTIVEGSVANRTALVDTLAQAFQSDPAISWIFPDPDVRRHRLPMMFDFLVTGDIKAGLALRAEGDEGATLWRAPGQAHSSTWDMVKLTLPLLRTFGTALGRALAIATAIDAHHPKINDYWYLHYAGVRPDHQGKGWGGALIRAGIARAQAEGKPAFLETATDTNIGLYQRLGFEVIDEWDVPNGGPHFWSMLLR